MLVLSLGIGDLRIRFDVIAPVRRRHEQGVEPWTVGTTIPLMPTQEARTYAPKLGLQFDLDFLLIAEGEDQERRECADCSQRGHPPDVPDECKAGHNRKERGHKAGRRVLRHLDRRVVARMSLLARRLRALLPVPMRIDLSYRGEDGQTSRPCRPQDDERLRARPSE